MSVLCDQKQTVCLFISLSLPRYSPSVYLSVYRCMCVCSALGLVYGDVSLLYVLQIALFKISGQQRSMLFHGVEILVKKSPNLQGPDC